MKDPTTTTETQPTTPGPQQEPNTSASPGTNLARAATEAHVPPKRGSTIPTEMPKADVSLEDIRNTIRVLHAVVDDRGIMSVLPPEERLALMMAAGRVSHPSKFEMKRMAKVHRRDQRAKSQEEDRQVRAQAEIRIAREASVFTAPVVKALPAPIPDAPPRPRLNKARACYVCKVEFHELHFFYDSMCKPCGDFNYQKRAQTASLQGKVALITGARVKIGFHASLMMLRAGATVVATTRFPTDAAIRYAREPDFDSFKDRLHVFGLDLRHAPSVEIFARWLDQSMPRLDILLNNAAQTVRRPPGFYAHLLPVEREGAKAAPPTARKLLEPYEALCSALEGRHALPKVGMSPDTVGLARWAGDGTGNGLLRSAELSLVPYAYEEGQEAPHLFPQGKLDADLQQVDLREQNSWRMTLHEVTTPEMLEVHLINAVAPFVLCARLKGLMMRVPSKDKHIVNVSAMEGSFSRRTKTDKHPHTNMAKAALNMMTLTSSHDYIKSGIHMNAVDTGWVTDEDPVQHADRKKNDLDFQPPLDIVDGAARICDPFFAGLNAGEHAHGKFFKDYRSVDW